MTAETTRARMIARFRLVALLIPLGLTAAAVIVQLAIAPSLPDPVAIHWGVGGVPDGFAPVWSVVAMTVLAGAVLPLAMGLSGLRGLRLGDQGGTYRFLGAVAAGLSALITVVGTWSLALQRGLDDAAGAPPVTTAVLASSVVALAVGAGAWLVQPSVPAARRPARTAEPLDLGAEEDAVWLRTTSLGGFGRMVLGAGLVLVGLGTVAAWLLPSDRALAWSLTGSLVVLVAVTAVTGAFRVRVDRHGLAVTSLIGLPRLRVPVADVEAAGVVDVNPAGEFGGVGLRTAPGRFGVVLRSGEAIQVTRRSGRQFVVTVDDAETAVALLLAYRARARATS